MRIGIDARFYREQGIGRYVRNLISQLQKIDTENEYYIFLLQKDFEDIQLTENFHKVLADIAWYGVAEQVKLPSLIKKYNLDLMHFPHLNVPLLYSGKFVVTIHDLIHHDFKMKSATTRNPLVYEVKHQVLKGVTRQAIKRSQKILVPSHFVKSELERRFKVKDSKIVVTPEAVDDKIHAIVRSLSQDVCKKILKKYGVESPFLLYVGNAHPHKNVEGLIKAFLELRKKYQELQLVFGMGHNSTFWDKIQQEYPSFHPHPRPLPQGRRRSEDVGIIYAGFVPDEDLAALYKSAQAYVFPSFSEGFGIPLLEAMACGCPVVSSNKTSLPEVGGDAALYFDPTDQSDMVEKISQVLDDQKLRDKLIAKGEKRVQQFSWEKMAKQTLEVYKNS